MVEIVDLGLTDKNPVVDMTVGGQLKIKIT